MRPVEIDRVILKTYNESLIEYKATGFIKRAAMNTNLHTSTCNGRSSLKMGETHSNTIKRTYLVVAVAAVLTLSGCASTGSRTQSGAIIGGLIGAVAGAVAGDTEGAVFGAVAGALVGGAVGNYQDKQQRELEEQLAAEIEAELIEIQRLEDETLQVSLSSAASFDIGSSALKPGFLPALDRLGAVLQQYDKTIVHVIGHTDSTGTEEYNQGLSRDRAVSVANYTRDAGIDRQRLNVEGRGEFEPRETNETIVGRQANRRVEIYLRPVVEGQQEVAYESPYYN